MVSLNLKEKKPSALASHSTLKLLIPHTWRHFNALVYMKKGNQVTVKRKTEDVTRFNRAQGRAWRP